MNKNEQNVTARKPVVFPSGAYFMAKRSEVAATLFKPLNGKTASGHYSARKGGVMFFNLKGEPFVFLVANRHSEYFFVSCNRDEKGRIFYVHSTTSEAEKMLGLDGLKYSAKTELAESIAKTTQPEAR